MTDEEHTGEQQADAQLDALVLLFDVLIEMDLQDDNKETCHDRYD